MSSYDYGLVLLLILNDSLELTFVWEIRLSVAFNLSVFTFLA